MRVCKLVVLMVCLAAAAFLTAQPALAYGGNCWIYGYDCSSVYDCCAGWCGTPGDPDYPADQLCWDDCWGGSPCIQ